MNLLIDTPEKTINTSKEGLCMGTNDDKINENTIGLTKIEGSFTALKVEMNGMAKEFDDFISEQKRSNEARNKQIDKLQESNALLKQKVDTIIPAEQRQLKENVSNIVSTVGECSRDLETLAAECTEFSRTANEFIMNQEKLNEAAVVKHEEMCNSVNILTQEVKDLLMMKNQINSNLWRLGIGLLLAFIVFIGKQMWNNYSQKSQDHQTQQMIEAVYDELLKRGAEPKPPIKGNSPNVRKGTTGQ